MMHVVQSSLHQETAIETGLPPLCPGCVLVILHNSVVPLSGKNHLLPKWLTNYSELSSYSMNVDAESD